MRKRRDGSEKTSRIDTRLMKFIQCIQPAQPRDLGTWGLIALGKLDGISL